MSKVASDLSTVTTVGLDLAKHVFYVHGVDEAGEPVNAKAVRRRDLLTFFSSLPKCLVGIEACSSAHHLARQLSALGHDVRLMPPVYVCQTTEERCRRRGSDLRSGNPSFDAVRFATLD